MKTSNPSLVRWALSGMLWLLAGCTVAANVASGDGGACASTSECSASQYCSAGACYPKQAVGSCGATSEHAANDACTGGLCLGGACCSSACAANDAICGATSCDVATGACQYPSQAVACGPAENCTGGVHTPASICNGQGGCTLAQATPCASQACFDAQRCVISCHDNSGCASSEYCASNQCTPKVSAGGVCGATATSPADSSCLSGACLGTRCCTSVCDTGDPQCGANSCDSSGACVYPASTTTCGALQGCSGQTYTPQSTCNGQGACAASPPQDCAPYACDEPGAKCYSACTLGGGECAADGYCNALTCQLKSGPGTPCAATSTSDANQACLSSICSVNCCVLDCPPDPATNNCKGTCDSQGACAPQSCPNNFGCSGTATCNTGCIKDADCATKTFCDRTGVSGCCGSFAGNTVYIDGSNGDDTLPCCGTHANPCQTISHAMKLIAKTGTSGATLQVSNGDGSASWTANESYPIHLGLGVALNAPNIRFTNHHGKSDLFQVYAYGATDTATVTIQGGAKGIVTDAVIIGFDLDLEDGTMSGDETAYHSAIVPVNDSVDGETALPLVLSEVWLHCDNESLDSYDLKVGAGANVTLGPHPVYIGDGTLLGLPINQGLDGRDGIFCKGSGATIADDPKATAPVLAIDGRGWPLDVEDGCTVTLAKGPRLGGKITRPTGWDGTISGCVAPNPPQDNYFCEISCIPVAQVAVMAVGSGSVTFGSAAMPGAILCANIGFDQETSNSSGSPTIAVNGAVVDLVEENFCYPPNDPTGCGAFNYSCAGALVTAGNFSASASTFRNSYMGVFVGANAESVDLSGGGNGGNTFGCNNSYPQYGPNTQYSCRNYSDIVTQGFGADVVNASATIGINAQNATWDNYDTSAGMTQTWSCSDTTYSNCTCSGPNCSLYASPGTPPDDADAVYLSTNAAGTPLDTSVGVQATATSCQ